MIVVTGGAGFIGSNLVHGLNKRGHKNILIVDDLTDGSKHKNLNRLEFIDYVDYRVFLANLESYSINMVFHQGACSDTTETNGHYIMSVNYDYTKALFHYCVNNKKPFIFASSASVYGNGDAGFVEQPECEYPLNMYAFSKYQFDRYYRMYKASNNIDSQVVSLRYFNVYGPQENHKGKMASVAFHLYNQVKNGESMRLFEGSEHFRRDFIYVADVVDVNLFFMDHPKLSGIYNCGTGAAESFLSIADAVQNVFPDAKIDFIPFPEHLKGKYQTYTEADLAKLRNAGYDKPFMSVPEGIRHYMGILMSTGGYII